MPYERKVLELKYAALPFCKLNESELNLAATKMLFSIHIITGWELHEDEGIQNQFKWHLKSKMVESYPNCNAQEMEYAFRNNTTVKDWGKFMNLALIDEVMIPYLEKRQELSEMELSKERPKELPMPVEKMKDEEFIETNRNIFKGSKLWQLISPKCYDLLTKKGEIKLSEAEKEVIKKKSRSHFFSGENKENLNGLTHAEQERWIMDNAKRISVAEYFNK